MRLALVPRDIWGIPTEYKITLASAKYSMLTKEDLRKEIHTLVPSFDHLAQTYFSDEGLISVIAGEGRDTSKTMIWRKEKLQRNAPIPARVEFCAVLQCAHVVYLHGI